MTIETKQLPARIYLFYSTEKEVKINIPLQIHAVKAFTLEDALATLQKEMPQRNYSFCGNPLLQEIIDRWQIQTVNILASPEEKQVEPENEEYLIKLLKDRGYSIKKNVKTIKKQDSSGDDKRSI